MRIVTFVLNAVSCLSVSRQLKQKQGTNALSSCQKELIHPILALVVLRSKLEFLAEIKHDVGQL